MILFVDYTMRFPAFTLPFYNSLKTVRMNAKLIGGSKFLFPIIFAKMVVYCLLYRKVTIITSDLYFPARLKWIELLIFRLLKRIANVNIHHIVHNFKPHESSRDSEELIYNRYYGLCDQLIVLSDTARNKFIDKHNVLVLSHGIAFRDYGVSDVHKVSDEIRLLIFGQVRRYKGVLEFIRIIKEIDTVHLTIAGECKDVLLDKEISTLVSLSHNITYCNSYLESFELDNLLKATDVVVFPYVNITTSGAVYKALEYRKIIVTSDLPYFVELRDKGLVNFCFSSSDIRSLNAFLNSLRSKTFKERRDLSHLSWMNIVKSYVDAGAVS